MKKVMVVVISSLLFAGLVAARPAEAATPTWTFTVKVGVSTEVINARGGETATQALVNQQLATVSSRFTRFRGTIKFVPSVFYTFSNSPVDETFKPHPEANFLVIYTELPNVSGGWQGSNQSVLQAWTPDWGGVFSSYGTDGLTHEFGHARGAVDLYGLNVMSNPVNGATYTAPQSIMTYPYGETLWDNYSRSIINASDSTIYSGAPIVDKSLPSTYSVVAKNKSTGKLASGAAVKVYPVEWFSGAVTPSPLMSGKTGAFGKWQLPRNPFAPGTAGKPWDLAFPNFLVVVTWQGRTAYRWLPLADVGSAYFAGVTSYKINITV